MKLIKNGLAAVAFMASSAVVANTNVAFQQVLDRNSNPYIAEIDTGQRVFVSGYFKTMIGGRTPADSREKFAIDVIAPRVNLIVDGVINKWAVTHIALNFANPQAISLGNSATLASVVGTTTTVTSVGNLALQRGTTGFYRGSGIFTNYDSSAFRPYNRIVEEAYITLGNLHELPVYFRMGIGNIPFGLYDKNEIPAKYTTMFTQTQATAMGQLGFADASGFFGSAYFFRGLVKRADYNLANATTAIDSDGFPHINNFGASLGYCMVYSDWSAKFVADYLYNVAGALDMIRTLSQTTSFDTPLGSTGISANRIRAYEKEVMAVHVGTKLTYMDFDVNANFFTALSKFDGKANIFAGKRPMAVNVGAGYTLRVNGIPTRFGASFQMTANIKEEAISSSRIDVYNGDGTVSTTGKRSGALPGIIGQYRGQFDITAQIYRNVEAGMHIIVERGYKGMIEASKDPKFQIMALASLTAKIA